MKKQLKEALSPQELLKAELGKRMSPVGLQIFHRALDMSEKPHLNKNPYTPDVKEFSLRLFRNSKSAYKYVHKVFPDSLPTAYTVRAWMKTSLENKDPFASAIESVATGDAESARKLLDMLEAEPGEQGEEAEEPPAETHDDQGNEEAASGKEVYFFEDDIQQLVSVVEGAGGEEEMPELQSESDGSRVKVVWTMPQGPANYTLGEDGMSILINVSEDQDYYKNNDS